MTLKLLVLISTLVVFSISARADSIITDGTVSLSRSFATQVTNMNFRGANFSVLATGRTAGPVSILPCGGTCSSNSLLNLSAIAGSWGFSDLTGGMSINGTSYQFVNTGPNPPNPPGIWGSGGIEFTAGSVLIPDTGETTITLSSTFTTVPNHSSLGGSYLGGGVGTGQLFGVGNVTVTLRLVSPGTYLGDRAEYTFLQTPEPATLILLGSGVLGIIAKRRLKRH